MARLIKFLLLSFCFVSLSVSAAIKGNVEYTIPIEYKNLDEAVLESKAEVYYTKSLKTRSGVLTDDITQGLILYTILENKKPENIIYPIRLGNLYDKIGKDRYAKGCYHRAMGVDSSRPEPYFYLGEFYYKRQLYRRALKMYLRAQKHGYKEHHQTVLRLKDIYLKLGDKEAYSQI